MEKLGAWQQKVVSDAMQGGHDFWSLPGLRADCVWGHPWQLSPQLRSKGESWSCSPPAALQTKSDSTAIARTFPTS